MCTSLFGTEHRIKLITSLAFFSLRLHFNQDLSRLPSMCTYAATCILERFLHFPMYQALQEFYESNLSCHFKLTVHLFYSDVTFQPSSDIQCVLLKNVRLASLEFSSCSVYPVIFVAPLEFFINVSKQFKVES